MRIITNTILSIAALALIVSFAVTTPSLAAGWSHITNGDGWSMMSGPHHGMGGGHMHDVAFNGGHMMNGNAMNGYHMQGATGTELPFVTNVAPQTEAAPTPAL